MPLFTNYYALKKYDLIKRALYKIKAMESITEYKYSDGRIVLNNYTKEDTKKYIETYNRVKVLNEYTDGGLKTKLKDDLEIKPILITLNHDPHSITSGKSWEVIEDSRSKIFNTLLKEESIVYVISTIEIHTKKGLTKKGKQVLDERINKNTQNAKSKGKANPNPHKVSTKNREKKVRKGTSKASVRYIEKGLSAMTLLNRLLSGKDVMKTVHSYIIKDFWSDPSIIKSEYWDDNDIHDKIRLIMAFYDMINAPVEVYRVFNILFSKDEASITINWIEVIDEYSFLIDDILTLEGYPHLHFAIGMISREGEYLRDSEIYSRLYDLNVMDDIQVDEKKSKKKYLGSIPYVLKNNRTDIVKANIDGAIIKGYVRLDSIVEPLKGLAQRTLASGRTKKIVEMELRYISTNLKPMSASTKYEMLASYIITKMKEGDYVICEEKIYRKREGSKMSYCEYMEIDDFYDNITLNAKHQRFANKHKKAIIARMRSKEVLIEGITEPEGLKIEFPKITMDKENVWVECKNFFFSVLTGFIVQANTKYYCYHYCDWLTLKQLSACINVHMKGGLWTSILRNSKLDIREVCSEIYRLIALPQIPKGGVWHGHGTSNSGKSTLLKPFLNIFPPDQIGTIKSNIGRFDLYSIRDKAIIQMEEISPYTLDREDGLKLLGREPMKVEKKHGGSDRALILGRQIYTSNDSTDEISAMMDGGFNRTIEQMRAYDNRIVNMEFDTIQEVLIDASSEIINETALTVITCGYYYFDNKYNEGKNGEILNVLRVYESVDDIEREIKRVLEKYRSYYKGSNERPNVIKDNAEYIEENEVIVLGDGKWVYKRDEIDHDDK